jgi:hypothetical protein
MTMEPQAQAQDPFELPDWLGLDRVCWQSTGPTGVRSVAHGRLVSLDEERSAVDLQIMAADRAFPTVVCSDADRRLVHQNWHYGEVTLLRVEDTLTLAIPGTTFSADLLCEAVSRLAKALGAERSRFYVLLNL